MRKYLGILLGLAACAACGRATERKPASEGEQAFGVEVQEGRERIDSGRVITVAVVGDIMMG
ncbi:MAG: hypothetical protein IJ729_00465, partial [Alloprevotella sp.]|nr:hypothetical protein [Alloprevotella sp.]